jgi:hypothetical protein
MAMKKIMTLNGIFPDSPQIATFLCHPKRRYCPDSPMVIAKQFLGLIALRGE